VVGRSRWREARLRGGAPLSARVAGPLRPPLRRLVAAALIAVSLLSLLTLGTVTVVRARALLATAIERALTDQQGAQVRAIQAGLRGVRDAVVLIAGSPRTAEALVALSRGFDELDDPQADVAAPGPDTAYARADVRYGPAIDRLRDALGFGDVLLVDADGDVVWTAEERDDLGTGLRDGPYADTALGRAMTEGLARAGVGETVVVDFEAYPPAGGDPTMFVAAPVSDGTEVVGAVAAEVPVATLNTLTTVGGQWDRTALGDTGETYVVGPDRRLRSDARGWLEDPEAYLQAVEGRGTPADVVAAIEEAGTTVLLQPADTEAVGAALDGDRFVGATPDYLGQDSLTVAGPLGVEDLDWVVVSDVDVGEALRPVRVLTRRLLVVAILLVVAVAVLSLWLADRMTRPVAPVVAIATALAAGDLDARAPPLGNDELGDVARRLNTLGDDLRDQREAQLSEERELTEVLAAVLPHRLVDPLRRGDIAVSDLIDDATVVTMSVVGPLQQAGLDPETSVELSARLSGALESAAVEHGLERIHSASGRHMFAAGLGQPDAGTDRAVAFVHDVRDVLDRFEHDTGVAADYSAGLCAGAVASGLLGDDHLTYGVFGEPLRVAMALDGAAATGQVLLAPALATDLGPRWSVEPVPGLVDLRGDPLDAVRLVPGG
jgi:HAMP domain-containing protein